jgi:hypothetical protein
VIPHLRLAHSTAKLAAEGGLGNLWSWDLDRVAYRLRNRLGWTADFTALVEKEYRRFMSLETSANGNPLGMRGPVDDFWHEHILFTRDYASFCDAVAGKFLHHEPADADSSPKVASYSLTLMLLEQHFGPVELDVWPDSGASQCDNCAMCDKIEPVARKR